MEEQNIFGMFGQEIEEVDYDGDRVYIRITNGWDIVIYNDMMLNGRELSSLVGLFITSLNTSESNVEIVLSDGGSLNVSLLDDDYKGPEAMLLNGPNDLVVVWN